MGIKYSFLAIFRNDKATFLNENGKVIPYNDDIREKNYIEHGGNKRMSYTYNERYLLKDGKPWFPVMGEIHYSRLREEFWEESLRKMKAGGITIAATYVFWIHHEEEEGVFDFSGCRNLKRFVEVCRKVGISLFLRIGPWCHGEVRNGGFPDWLLNKGIELRSDNPEYLQLVERFWFRVYEQVQGEMYEDGGPVIGIQIENEYGHVGGFTGTKGQKHMKTLKKMAEDLGFRTPLYTATGWGGAMTGELLPVMSGYCEAPWDQRITEIEANGNYVFTENRNDLLVANDHHVSENLTFDVKKFPFLTAELGGGLQVTEHRRPVSVGKDIGAMSLTKLGSGVAMLGYYMYHGGSNPEGKYSTLQESKETGYPNNVPVINYDFRAPIRQYGQISDTYKEIKLLAFFLKDFGEDIAVLQTEIYPEIKNAEDLDTLRTAWRHDEHHGYIFFNNYQRRRHMKVHENVILEGKCEEKIQFPAITIFPDTYGFFPYHMKLENTELIRAVASPLCILEGNEENEYVFYGNYNPDFLWKEGKEARVIFISRQEALDAWKVRFDRDYLILSEYYVWNEDERLVVTGKQETKMKTYPKLPEKIAEKSGFCYEGTEGEFTVYKRSVPIQQSMVDITGSEQQEEYAEYVIEMRYSGGMKDTLLTLEYAGDKMEIYEGEKMVNDHFYTGETVELSMRYFDFPERLRIKIYPLVENAPRFLEKWPEMKEGRACELLPVSAENFMW